MFSSLHLSSVESRSHCRSLYKELYKSLSLLSSIEKQKETNEILEERVSSSILHQLDTITREKTDNSCLRYNDSNLNMLHERIKRRIKNGDNYRQRYSGEDPFEHGLFTNANIILAEGNYGYYLTGALRKSLYNTGFILGLIEIAKINHNIEGATYAFHRKF